MVSVYFGKQCCSLLLAKQNRATRKQHIQIIQWFSKAKPETTTPTGQCHAPKFFSAVKILYHASANDQDYPQLENSLKTKRCNQQFVTKTAASGNDIVLDSLNHHCTRAPRLNHAHLTKLTSVERNPVSVRSDLDLDGAARGFDIPAATFGEC